MNEKRKAYKKAYYQAHKAQIKAANKAWKESHKEECKAYWKIWKEKNKEQYKDYQKAYKKLYQNSDLNTLGKTKNSIRMKSRYYLRKYGHKIFGYEIHHCCSYNEPYKFIYCSKEMHRIIHTYLKQHNIDADSDHYDYIKHLLDNSVVLYGI